MSRPNLVYVDVETFYGRGYTLEKLDTEEYIRHPDFRMHGVGLAVDDGPTRWAAHDQVPDLLATVDWSNSVMVSHNVLFDGFALAHHYAVRPAWYRDTVVLSRLVYGMGVPHHLNHVAARLGLGAKLAGEIEKVEGKRILAPDEEADLGRYCVQDVDLCRDVHRALIDQIPGTMWLHVIDATTKMMTRPLVRIDTDVLDQYIQEHETMLESAAQRVVDLSPAVEGLTTDLLRQWVRSGPKLQGILEAAGVDVPTKPGKRGPTPAFGKTDEGMLTMLSHDDDLVAALCDLRVKVMGANASTRAEKLRALAGRGACPIQIAAAKASTGRAAGAGGLNFQNMNRGSALRRALVAPDDHQFVVGDLSQVEMRVGAWLAREENLLNALESGEDVYCTIASRMLGRVVTPDMKDDRQRGKIAALAGTYGGGAKPYQVQARAFGEFLSLDEADAMKRQFRDAHERYPITWRKFERMLRDGEGEYMGCTFAHDKLTLPSGRVLYYSDRAWETWEEDGEERDGWRYSIVKAKRRGEYQTIRRQIYGSKLYQNAVQALAGDLLAYALARWHHKVGEQWPAVLQVHDEIVAIVPDEDVERASSEMRKVLTYTPIWATNLPLAADTGYARRYGDVK